MWRNKTFPFKQPGNLESAFLNVSSTSIYRLAGITYQDLDSPVMCLLAVSTSITSRYVYIIRYDHSTLSRQ